MNARGTALITNPHPCSHIVYPYTDENLVEQAVCLYASAGLRDGEGVVLIMTKSHWEPFRLRLRMEGLNINAYERREQLICLTSEELLARFMADGMINEELFRSIVGDVISRARASVRNGRPARVRLFGEMVSQLRGHNLYATVRLEQLWNEVIENHDVSLLCTYALNEMAGEIPDSLMQLHSHNIEREKFTTG